MSTLKDLAQALDLSVMAVSKALRDAPDISEKTKARVRAEALRVNYIPNRAAQNLRSRQTHLLGAMVPKINDPYYSNLVWGIERQAESLGFQVLLSHSLDRADVELIEVRRLIARQAQGVLLVPAVRWQSRLATLELLRTANMPVVFLDRYPAGAERFPQTTWVVAQDQSGGEAATRHLLELGHKEILFLAGPNGSSAGAARFTGYQKALQAASIPFEDRRVFLAGSDMEAGKKAISQALGEKIRFTALVAFNDLVAIGAAELLQAQGYRIPDDVSVIGFGDGLLSENYRVPLTTMRIPQIDMGAASVHLLNDMLQAHPVVPRELPLELIVRKSTRPLAV